MKRIITTMIVVSFCTLSLHAGQDDPVPIEFDFIIESGYDSSFRIENFETLQMTGGGVGILSLRNDSYAEILNTTPFQQGIGGIEEINAADRSQFLIAGGEILDLRMHANASGMITGGIIHNIATLQSAAPEPHIEMLVRDYNYNAATNRLMGTWEDFSTFDILLKDQEFSSPVIQNIKFSIIPEPATLCLLGLGAFWLKRRRHLSA